MRMFSLFLAAGLLALSAGSAAASPAAQATAPKVPTGSLVEHTFVLHHQRAAEALELVRPLLSKQGTVKVQAATGALQIRDTLAALSRIVPVLKSFDHPAQPVEIEVYLLRVSSPQVSPPVASSPDLPAAIVERLRQLLHYEVFELVARADLLSREGEEVAYEGGEGFRLTFRLGTVLAGRRIRLHDFRISRNRGSGNDERELIHTNLNLWLDQPMAFGLARTEASPTALMIVMTCRKPGAGSEPKTERDP